MPELITHSRTFRPGNNFRFAVPPRGDFAYRAAELADTVAQRSDDYHVIHLKISSLGNLRNGSAAGECLEHSYDGGGKEGAVYARVLRLVEKYVAVHSDRFRR